MEWESESWVERGSLGLEAHAEVKESSGCPKWPMVCGMYLKISSLGGSFSTVRATVIQRNMERCLVLAGDLKHLVYYVISKLNKAYLAGDLKHLVYYVISKLNKAYLAGDLKRKEWG